MTKSNNGSGDFNILCKKDNSTVTAPHGRGQIDKTERYKWSTLDEPGEFRLIDKDELNIDGRYQREQISEKKIMDITRGFQWCLFGALNVSEREDGSLWVIDGGHRTRACFNRSDVIMVPCMVHHLSNSTEEALRFVDLNTLTSNVSAFDKYHASVYGGREIPVITEKILRSLGLTAVKGGMTTGSYISCVGAVQKCVEVSPEDTKKVLEFCLKLEGDHIVTGKLLQAMFILHQRFKGKFDIIDRFGDKLLSHTMRSLEAKMTEFSTLTGKGGNTVNARALLEVINHRRRNKLEW
jgi:hypothetical protein